MYRKVGIFFIKRYVLNEFSCLNFDISYHGTLIVATKIYTNGFWFVNSLAYVRSCCDFRYIILKHILGINFLGISKKKLPQVNATLPQTITQIAKFTGPTWGPPGSCRPQMAPMLAPWTLLSGKLSALNNGLVSSGNKPLSEPKLTKIYDTILCHHGQRYKSMNFMQSWKNSG